MSSITSQIPYGSKVVNFFSTAYQSFSSWLSTNYPNLSPKWVIISGIVTTFTFYSFSRRIYLTKVNKAPPQYFYDFPIIGSIFAMSLWPKQFRLEILPSYGDIVHYHVANIPFYKINNVNIVETVFKKAYNRPPQFKVLKEVANIYPDLSVVNEDEYWSDRRKVLMQSLVALLNKSQVEDKISRALQEIIYEHLDEKLDKITVQNPTDPVCHMWYPRECTQNASFNVIYLAMFNKISKLDDKSFQQYTKQNKIWVRDALLGGLGAQMPFPINLLFSEKTKSYRSSSAVLQSLIGSDYIDCVKNDSSTLSLSAFFRSKYNEILSPKGIDEKSIDEMIKTDLMVIFQAGIDTAAYTSEYGVLLLAKYPKVQEIVYNELVDVYGDGGDGKSSTFSLSKVFECPKFRAFIHEILRLANHAPDGFARSSDQDIRCLKYVADDNNGSDTICDYVESDVWYANNTLDISKNKEILYDYIIPKNSFIEGNIGYINLNVKDSWNLDPNPNELNLNYWLKNGKFVMNNKSIPFGISKRECPCQSLTIKELHAFFGNLLLKYEIASPNGNGSDMNIIKTWGEPTTTVDPALPVLIKYRK